MPINIWNSRHSWCVAFWSQGGMLCCFSAAQIDFYCRSTRRPLRLWWDVSCTRCCCISLIPSGEEVSVSAEEKNLSSPKCGRKSFLTAAADGLPEWKTVSRLSFFLERWCGWFTAVMWVVRQTKICLCTNDAPVLCCLFFLSDDVELKVQQHLWKGSANKRLLFGFHVGSTFIPSCRYLVACWLLQPELHSLCVFISVIC